MPSVESGALVIYDHVDFWKISEAYTYDGWA